MSLAETLVRQVLADPIPFSLDTGEMLVFRFQGTLESAEKLELFATTLDDIAPSLDADSYGNIIPEIERVFRDGATPILVEWVGGVELLGIRTAAYPVGENSIGDA